MWEKIFQRNYCSCVFLLPVDSNSLTYKKKLVCRPVFSILALYYCCLFSFFLLDSKDNPQARILPLKKNILTDLLESRGEQDGKLGS